MPRLSRGHRSRPKRPIPKVQISKCGATYRDCGQSVWRPAFGRLLQAIQVTVVQRHFLLMALAGPDVASKTTFGMASGRRQGAVSELYFVLRHGSVYFFAQRKNGGGGNRTPVLNRHHRSFYTFSLPLVLIVPPPAGSQGQLQDYLPVCFRRNARKPDAATNLIKSSSSPIRCQGEDVTDLSYAASANSSFAVML